MTDGPVSVSWGLMLLWRPGELTPSAKSIVNFTATYVKETPSLMKFAG